MQSADMFSSSQTLSIPVSGICWCCSQLAFFPSWLFPPLSSSRSVSPSSPDGMSHHRCPCLACLSLIPLHINSQLTVFGLWTWSKYRMVVMVQSTEHRPSKFLSLCVSFSLCPSLKFPEETEVDLLSVTVDEPSHLHHHHHHLHSPSLIEGQHSPVTPAVFSPVPPFQHDDMRRDDLSSSSSEDSEKEDEFERERPPSYRRPLWVAVLPPQEFLWWTLMKGRVIKCSFLKLISSAFNKA